MAKKKLKIFDEYYEAVMYCVNNGLKYKREKHETKSSRRYLQEGFKNIS